MYEANCFKVTSKSRGRYYSSMHVHRDIRAFQDRKIALVYYPVGKLVAPRIGKLFVFKDYDHAVRFAQPDRQVWEFELNVWSAYGENIQPIEYMIDWLYVKHDTLEQFWVTDKLYHAYVSSVPIGSMMADRVMLLEKVA